MVIFDSESELIDALQKYFEIVDEFAEGRTSFIEFNKKYNAFYFYYALDGHESDDEERLLLKKYRVKVEFFEEVTSILSGICSDEDAVKDIYINAGRYNSQVAKSKLKELVNSYRDNFNTL